MPAPIAGGLAILIARLAQHALMRVGSQLAAKTGGRAGAIAIGASLGAMTSDIINIDVLRRDSVQLAPSSDPEALEFAARQIHFMLGLDGGDVRFPSTGQIRVFHFDITNGNAWWTTRYYSAKSVKAARSAGARRGFSSGKRDMARTAIVGKG